MGYHNRNNQNYFGPSSKTGEWVDADTDYWEFRGTVKSSKGTGSANIDESVYGLQIGPAKARTTTANSYYPGIAFNHLLNYNADDSYLAYPQA